MILIATHYARSLVLTRLPEFLQPAVALADRLIQRFQKVKLFLAVSCLAHNRPILVVRRSTPHRRVRAHKQLPRSKTAEG